MVDEERLLTDIVVAVVAGLVISFITWLLQGTIHLVAAHPWLILAVGIVVAVATVLFRFWRGSGNFYFPYNPTDSDPDPLGLGDDDDSNLGD